MKKLNLLVNALVISTVILLSGCKSVPESKGVAVNPLDLMDGSGFIYASIPKKADSELYNQILKTYGFSNSSQISKYLDNVYLSLAKSKYGDFIELQGAVKGDLPVSYIEKNLSKDWNKEELKIGENNYNLYHSDGFEVSVPSKELLLFGRDNKTMIEKYNNFAFSDEIDIDFSTAINSEIYSFLSETDKEIRIISNDINYLLSIFMPEKNLNIKSTYLKVSIYSDSNNKDYYSVDVSLNFENEIFLKAGKAILSLALGENASKIEVDGLDLILKAFPLKKESVYTLRIM